MMDAILIGGGLALFVLIFALISLRIVPQSKAYVMERLGVYSRTWYTGLHIKIPFFEKTAKIIDLKEQILVMENSYDHYHYHNHGKNIKGCANYDVVKGEDGITRSADGRFLYSDEHNYHRHAPNHQPVITKDNVSMEIDAVVFYMVTDCKLFAYGHANPIAAIQHLVSTTLRNIVGELELDTILTSRDLINTRMRTILDEATDPWGVKVTRVELRNIIISDKELAEAMEKQMIAERRRRERIIEAEGIRKAEILVAEGKKQAAILEAEGKKQAEILAAEARREAMICEAEGEAEAILQVQQATAEGIKMVNASEPSKEVLTIKALEAFENAANGESNTIIIPSEIQGLAGLAKSASEVFKA